MKFKLKKKEISLLGMISLLFCLIIFIGLLKPLITGASISDDELVSIPTETMKEEIADEDGLISIPKESPTKEIEEEIITDAEDDLFRIAQTEDYTPVEIEYDPLGSLSGTNVTIRVLIRDLGITMIPGTMSINLYIDGAIQSQNNIADISDAFFGVKDYVSNFTWTATSGIHEIKIIVDDGNNIPEADENNNELTKMIGIDWPMFRQTPEHFGFSFDGKVPSTNTTIWNYTIGGDITSSPIVANSTIFIGDYENNVFYALNVTNGTTNTTQTWNYTLGGNVYLSSAAYAQDIVYIGSFDNNITALNATNGSLIWNYTTADDVVSSPVVASDMVFFGSLDNDTYAINATNGSYIWNYTTNGSINSSAAVVNNIVYFGSCDDVLYALNATNGNHVWNYSAGDDIVSSPVVINDTIYFGSHSNNITALNATNGSFIWNYTTGDDVVSSPAIAYDMIYVGSNDNQFYALNATNGSLIWNFTTGDNIMSSPAVANDTVYFGSLDDNIYALNATNGSEIWRYTTGDDVISSPAIGPTGMLYIGSLDDQLYAFKDPDTTLPTITFTYLTPQNDTKTRNNSVTINVTVVDDVTIDTCLLGWQYQGGSWANYTMTKSSGTASVLCNYTNSSLTDGLNYTYRVYANDSSGNWNVSKLRMFKDNILPTQSQPLLTATTVNNYTTENITCYNQSTTDSEGESVTNIYNWYKNGKSIMVLNLPFDNNDSGINTTKDYSGYNNDGALGSSRDDDSGEPTWTSSGRVGGAYDFDGVNDFIDLRTNPSLSNISTNITLEAWVYFQGGEVAPYIINKRRTSGIIKNAILLVISGTADPEKLAFGIENTTPINMYLSYANAIYKNQWTHIVATYDNNLMKLYINGTFVNSTPHTGGILSSGGRINWRIGNEAGGSSRTLDGMIDEVRIYNITLTDTQIYQRYIDTKDGHSSNQTIVSNETSVGDEWICEVTASDSHEDGIINRSSLSILNFPLATPPAIAGGSESISRISKEPEVIPTEIEEIIPKEAEPEQIPKRFEFKFPEIKLPKLQNSIYLLVLLIIIIILYAQRKYKINHWWQYPL